MKNDVPKITFDIKKLIYNFLIMIIKNGWGITKKTKSNYFLKNFGSTIDT